MLETVKPFLVEGKNYARNGQAVSRRRKKNYGLKN